jgi:hypothetical protein
MQSSDNQSAPQSPEPDLVATLADEDIAPSPPDAGDGSFSAEASETDTSDVPPDPPVQTDLGSEAEAAASEEAPDPPPEAAADVETEEAHVADLSEAPEPPVFDEPAATTAAIVENASAPSPPDTGEGV